MGNPDMRRPLQGRGGWKRKPRAFTKDINKTTTGVKIMNQKIGIGGESTECESSSVLQSPAVKLPRREVVEKGTSCWSMGRSADTTGTKSKGVVDEKPN